MALGAVRSGYASTTYAYRQTTTMTEEFYSVISAAAQKTEEKNNSHVTKHTMLPYGNTNVSYGMKAQYAPESTGDAQRQDVVEEEEGERDWLKYIREKLEELRVLIISGKGEQSYQIGNSSFTLKEWRKFLASFDSMEDAARELMRREQEAKEEKEEEE
ncbi:MAG: hypothetical protein NC251_12490 [Lachnoclostridium sp.]|nr:hypothetical protein [Lachnospira sp.]MCM1249233.1 hypothetical protein [Lachnoclostridium sp.]